MKSPILVVDDDLAVRAMSAGILRDAGYIVLEAAQANEAILQLDEHPTTTLLFTDVNMPGLNGYVLADMAVTRWPHLRILYTTAMPTTYPDDGRCGSRHGETLAKPYRAKQLTDAVAESLARPRPSIERWGDPLFVPLVAQC